MKPIRPRRKHSCYDDFPRDLAAESDRRHFRRMERISEGIALLELELAATEWAIYRRK